MPVVSIDIEELSGLTPGVDNLRDATLWFYPYRPYGSPLVTTNKIVVATVGGVATTFLPETPVGNGVYVEIKNVRLPERGWRKFIVAIPGTDCNLFDLPHLDPTTLDPAAPLNPAWLDSLNTAVPLGGTTGQVLAKASDADHDDVWVDQTGGGGGGAVDSVNTKTGVVVLDQDDVADGTTAKQYTVTEKAKLAAIIGTNTGDQDLSGLTPKTRTVNGHALTADVVVSASDITTGTLPTSVLPAIAITDVFPVASQAAMLALSAEKGDVAVRSDVGVTYILSTNSPSTLADWLPLPAIGAVLSVAGQQGVVVLSKADVGLDQVNNTSDANKPISDAAAAALALLAPKASPAFTGTPTFASTSMYASSTRTAAATVPINGAMIQNCDATTAPFNLALAATTTSGLIFVIKKVDATSNAVTVVGTFDGATNIVLANPNDYVIVYSTGSAGVWRVIGTNVTLGPAQLAAVGKRTRRAMAVLSTPTSGYLNNAEICWRLSQTFPETTTRWRFRIRNYRVLSEAAVLVDASFTGVYHGEQVLDSSGIDTAGFVAAPRQASGAFSLGAAGAEYISPWITATADQITGGKPWLFSFAYTGGGTSNGQASSQGKMFYQVGAGSSAVLAQQAATSFLSTGASPFDIRIEYECVTDKKIVLGVGDSLMFGTSSAVIPQILSAPSTYSRRTKNHLANGGIPSATAAQWAASVSDWKWQRWDPANVAYDAALIQLLTNDIAANSPVATMRTNLIGVMAILRGLAINEIHATTVPPRGLPHARLSKAVVIGDTTITVDTGGLAVGTWQLGEGLAAESVTTSGTPTAVGDGTFTYTTTAAAKAHRVGETAALSQETLRLGINAVIRGLVNGLTTSIQLDRALQANFDSALLQPEYAQSDGLHPTAAGLGAMASVISI